MENCTLLFESLLDFHDGKATEPVRAEVNRHLSNDCKSCKETMQWIDRVVSEIKSEALVSAPEHLINQARSLYRKERLKVAIETVIANLTFDSSRSLGLSGARGSVSDATVRRLFTSEEYKIDVAEERVSETELYVISQVFSRDGDQLVLPTAATLHITEGDSIDALIEDGEMHFSPLPNSSYQIQIKLKDKLLILPSITEITDHAA